VGDSKESPAGAGNNVFAVDGECTDPSLYREQRPPAALADHAASLWVRDVPSTASATVRVIPDGSADIMWVQTGSEVETVVAGPDSEGQMFPLPPGSRMAAVRFAPGAASAVLGLPLDALRNLRVPLAELWGAGASELAERAATADRPELTLAAGVQQRITGPPDASARAIARRLERTSGPGVVADLADELGLSERQLHRRSRAAFGYGPKTLQQVLRFQRALRLAREGGRLADVAAVTGYADQAHMARETRRLAGVPLTELL
jgi:AraC-like DNA-binding protein